MNRVLYHEWFPQIMYNHHQTGPQGTVMFAPPFRDPFNYNFDPLIPAQPRSRGRGDAHRFAGRQAGRDEPPRRELFDVVERRAAHHGVLPQHDRAAHRDHRESHTDPDSIPAERHLPDSNLQRRSSRRRGTSGSRSTIRSPPTTRSSTSPHGTGRTSSSTSTRWARTDRAGQSRQLDAPVAAHGSLRGPSGARASWPRSGAAAQAAPAATSPGREPAAVADEGGRLTTSKRCCGIPRCRDPRGFILPSDQPDFLTATKFINALIKTGVDRAQATRRSRSAARVIRPDPSSSRRPRRSALTFSTCSSPRTTPTTPYPGGPPSRPYDNAGWTLAYQMGVKFDRILEAFDGPFKEIRDWRSRSRAGSAAPATAGLPVVAMRSTIRSPSPIGC